MGCHSRTQAVLRVKTYIDWRVKDTRERTLRHRRKKIRLSVEVVGFMEHFRIVVFPVPNLIIILISIGRHNWCREVIPVV